MQHFECIKTQMKYIVPRLLLISFYKYFTNLKKKNILINTIQFTDRGFNSQAFNYNSQDSIHQGLNQSNIYLNYSDNVPKSKIKLIE